MLIKSGARSFNEVRSTMLNLVTNSSSPAAVNLFAWSPLQWEIAKMVVTHGSNNGFENLARSMAKFVLEDSITMPVLGHTMAILQPACHRFFEEGEYPTPEAQCFDCTSHFLSSRFDGLYEFLMPLCQIASSERLDEVDSRQPMVNGKLSISIYEGKANRHQGTSAHLGIKIFEDGTIYKIGCSVTLNTFVHGTVTEKVKRVDLSLDHFQLLLSFLQTALVIRCLQIWNENGVDTKRFAGKDKDFINSHIDVIEEFRKLLDDVIEILKVRTGEPRLFVGGTNLLCSGFALSKLCGICMDTVSSSIHNVMFDDAKLTLVDLITRLKDSSLLPKTNREQ